MENKIGKDFANLAQHVAYNYAGTLPPFIPVAFTPASGKAGVTAEAQRQLYTFLCCVAEKLYEQPELFGLPIEPDAAYLPGELQNNRPELIKAMQNVKKKIEELYQLLIRLAELGELKGDRLCVPKAALKLSGKTLSKLKAVALQSEIRKDETHFWCADCPLMLPAWKLLASFAATNEKNPIHVFSHCFFDPVGHYTKEIF